MKKFMKSILPDFIVKYIKKFCYRVRLEKYKYEIYRRQKYGIFEYQKLAKDMDLVTKEYGFNAFYGLDKIVKDVRGYKQNCILDAAIEHGIQRGNTINAIDTGKNTIYTFGGIRASFLKSKFPEKEIIGLGPYVKYAESILSESKVQELKKELGKTLLVFTAHSTHYATAQYNSEYFIEEIERIKLKNGFDTVLVCMYWKDILLNKEKPFEKQGYKICTAGHMFDYRFMSRLKSIICLADVTMSNWLGTHLGYCICLNKAHYLYCNNVNMENDEIYDAKYCFDHNYYSEFSNSAFNIFGIYKECIKDSDIKFVKKYWGEW